MIGCFYIFSSYEKNNKFFKIVTFNTMKIKTTKSYKWTTSVLFTDNKL